MERRVQRSPRMDLLHLDDYKETSAAGFTKRMIRQSAGGLVFRLNFEPGQSLPAHTHAESEITVTVLEGEGQAGADGRTQPIRAGTILHCTGNESFDVQNTGTKRLSLLVFLYPGNPKFAGNVR